MNFDENGNPVTSTDTGLDSPPNPNDVTGDPSSPNEPDLPPDPDPNPEEDPSSSEPAGRKPKAEERIGQLIGEREYWKRVAMNSATPSTTPEKGSTQAVDSESELNPDDFYSTKEYIEAVKNQMKKEIESTIDKKLNGQAEAEAQAAITKSALKAREKYPDFDSVALNPAVPTSETMVDAMKGDYYADILYALGKNIPEANRIFSLPPVQQIKEIGIIESRLNKTKTKSVSSAPNPVPTISGVNPGAVEKPDSEKTRKELHKDWEKKREEALRRKYG